MGLPPSIAKGTTQRRRSQRVFATVHILVQGKLESKDPFEEETETLVINAHGALILLGTPVSPRQKLSLIHSKTKEEQECTVVGMGPAQSGKTHVSIEFTTPAPKFWRVTFPPEDWTPRHPDARAIPH